PKARARGRWRPVRTAGTACGTGRRRPPGPRRPGRPRPTGPSAGVPPAAGGGTGRLRLGRGRRTVAFLHLARIAPEYPVLSNEYREPRPRCWVLGTEDSLLRTAFALAEYHDPIDRPAREDLVLAVRPAHVDGVHALGLAEAEVGARVVAAQVTGARVQPALPA